MINIRNFPIEPPAFCPQKPSIAAVENLGAIPSHLPAKEKPPLPNSLSKPKYSEGKPVSFPPTLGGNLDLKA